MSKNVEFIDQLCELMGGDRFFLCDQYCQDEIANHIAKTTVI